MLKFSAYPYLIRGQPLRGVPRFHGKEDRVLGALVRYVLGEKLRVPGEPQATVIVFRGGRARGAIEPPNTKHRLEGLIMTLEQACPSEYQRAQCAFKDSMTHWNSAIRITYRISLRSSSMPEPRDPLLKVLL